MKPVVLIVLDGWGLAEPGPGNAVSLASTPVFDDLWARFPHTQLEACGPAVGLPEGQMGNSEVGHLNLGAGAVVKQDLTRIDEAVRDGTLAANEVLRAALTGADRVHLIGLVSDGGVHSSDRHLLEHDGSPNTEHSLNPVPLVVTAEVGALRDGGILADVAPTLLQLARLEQPEAMTGRSLLRR